MDFSSIVNEQNYKYIESPVIYKFLSDKFINNNNRFSISQNTNNQMSMNKIGNMLFRKEHSQTEELKENDNGQQYQAKGNNNNNNHNHVNNNNANDTELELHSVVSGSNYDTGYVNGINSPNYQNNYNNNMKNQQNQQRQSSTNQSNNGKGLFGINNLYQNQIDQQLKSSSSSSNNNQKPILQASQYQLPQKTIFQKESPKRPTNLYSKININLKTDTHASPHHRQSTLLGTYPLKQSSNSNSHSRKLSQTPKFSQQQFPYYRKLFSPDKPIFKPLSLSPSHPSLTLPNRQSNTQQQLTRLAANELILQTQRQLLQNQTATLKIQLKTYEKKVQELNQQKQEWVRCKKRNQILEREYQLVSQEIGRLKQERSLELRRRSSQVEKVDLRDVNEQDEYGKRLLFNNNLNRKKEPTQQMMNPFYESKIKQHQLQITQLQQQLNHFKSLNTQLTSQNQRTTSQNHKLTQENHRLIEQNKRLKRSSNMSTVPSLSFQKPPHQLQNELIHLKQHNIKLQQQKQSYLSNYKLLKNQRERQCKELKQKQEDICASLQKLKRQMAQLNEEKDTLQKQNRKLKNINRQTQEQLQIMQKKYSTIKFDYQDINHTLQINTMNTQQQWMIKTQQLSSQDQKHYELINKIQQITHNHQEKLVELTKENDRQKTEIKEKYQNKIQDYESKITELKEKIKQKETVVKELQTLVKEIENNRRDMENKMRDVENKGKIMQGKIEQMAQYIREKENKLKEKEQKAKEIQGLLKEKQHIIREAQNKLRQKDDKMREINHMIKQKQDKLKQVQDKLLKYQERQNLINQGQIRKHQQKVSQAQQKAIQYHMRLTQLQQTIASLQSTIGSKQSIIEKKEKQIEQLAIQRQEKWSQLLQLKQKYMEINEMNTANMTEKTTLRQELIKKQEQKSLVYQQLQSQLNQLTSLLLSKQQQELILKQSHQSLIVVKENEIKKQRAEIQGLLHEVVKLRQVKNHNYKLMEMQKNSMRVDETVGHLWQVKEAEYQNIVKLIGGLAKENSLG